MQNNRFPYPPVPKTSHGAGRTPQDFQSTQVSTDVQTTRNQGVMSSRNQKNRSIGLQ